MRHPSIKAKGSTAKVIENIKFAYMYDGSTLSPLSLPYDDGDCTISEFDGVQHLIKLPNSNVYLLLVFDNFIDVIRVGTPTYKIMFFMGFEPLTFDIYDTNYNVINTITSAELVNGVQSVKIPVGNTFKGLLRCEHNNQIVKIPLSFPYPNEGTSTTVPTTGVILANSNFMDSTNKLSTFGFSGSQHSYFDILTGSWVEDINTTAKASDLAKAIAYKYNLNYDDPSDTKFIGKFIKFFQTYDEEIGTALSYFVGFTPDEDFNNFDLLTNDEYGSLVIRGIDLYLTDYLETTTEGSTGIDIPFNQLGMSVQGSPKTL